MRFRQRAGWQVTQDKSQRLVFIEPHGMRMEGHPSNNPKVNLHQKLQVQSASALKKSKISYLTLDSFVFSATHDDDLRKLHGAEWDRKKYADAHILFFNKVGKKSYLESIVSAQQQNTVSEVSLLTFKVPSYTPLEYCFVEIAAAIKHRLYSEPVESKRPVRKLASMHEGIW